MDVEHGDQNQHLSEITRSYLLKDLARLSDSKDSLSRQIEEAASKVEYFEREREAVCKTIEAFKLLLAARPAPPVVDPPEARSESATLTIESKPADSLAEHILETLASVGKPQHYRDLTAAIKLKGVAVGGRDPAATILSILLNKRYGHRFSRVGRGIYDLAESKDGTERVRLKSSKRRKRRK